MFVLGNYVNVNLISYLYFCTNNFVDRLLVVEIGVK